MHLFKVLTQNVLSHSSNILITIKTWLLVNTLFEHFQYNFLVLIIVAKSKGLTSEIKLILNINHSSLL